MLKRGYYLVPRGLMDSPEFETDDPATSWQAFVWSIERASIKEHGMWFNGVEYLVKRGEFVTSIRDMAAQLRWTDKRARGFMAKMIKRGRWAKRPAHNGAKAPTVLIVCNYDVLQKPSLRGGAAKDTARGKPRAKQGRKKGAQQNHRENHRLMKGEKNEEAIPSKSTAEIRDVDIADAVKAWNATARVCGWRQVHRLSDVRRNKVSSLLEKVGLQGLQEAVMKAGWSEWLGGEEPPPWFTFDALLDPENFNHLVNGDYDKRFH